MGLLAQVWPQVGNFGCGKPYQLLPTTTLAKRHLDTYTWLQKLKLQKGSLPLAVHTYQKRGRKTYRSRHLAVLIVERNCELIKALKVNIFVKDIQSSANAMVLTLSSSEKMPIANSAVFSHFTCQYLNSHLKWSPKLAQLAKCMQIGPKG